LRCRLYDWPQKHVATLHGCESKVQRCDDHTKQGAAARGGGRLAGLGWPTPRESPTARPNKVFLRGMHAKPNDAYMTAHTCVNARQRRLNRKGRMSERISWQSCHHARLLGATRPNTTASACRVPRTPLGHRDARHYFVLHHFTHPTPSHLQKWCPHEVRMAASLIVSPHSPHARSSFSSVALASRAAASAAISRADIILLCASQRTAFERSK
jgi:hypothetical protein